MLNVLYNESVNEDVLQEEISFMQESLNVDRAILAYESVCKKEALDLKDAELRCMTESGDIDLLEQYYIEAVDGVEEKKEGLLEKIWSSIKNLFTKIKNFIFGSKQKKALEEAAAKGDEIGLDEEAHGFVGKLKELLAFIKGFPSSIKEWFGDENNPTWKKILAIIVPETIVGSAVALTAVGVKKHSAKELNDLADEAKEISESAEKVSKFSDLVNKLPFLNNIKDGAANAKSRVLSAINKITGWLKSSVAKLLSFVSGKFEKVKDTNTSNKKNTSGKPKEAGGMTASELKKKDKAKWAEWFDQAGDIKRKLKGVKDKDKQKKLYDERIALNKKYGLNINESVKESAIEAFDFSLPEVFVEESCSEDAMEIAELLEIL